MAEEKSKPQTWPVTHARFAAPVVSPHNSSPLTEAKTDGRTLVLEFDPGLRMVIVTALRPKKAAKEGEPVAYEPHPDRPVTRVPVENVVFMR